MLVVYSFHFEHKANTCRLHPYLRICIMRPKNTPYCYFPSILDITNVQVARKSSCYDNRIGDLPTSSPCNIKREYCVQFCHHCLALYLQGLTSCAQRINLFLYKIRNIMSEQYTSLASILPNSFKKHVSLSCLFGLYQISVDFDTVFNKWKSCFQVAVTSYFRGGKGPSQGPWDRCF